MNRIISYYGDDFTGSTDVMEALASHGVETVLFTRVPTDAEFAPFKTFQAVGLAGHSRSESPAWMDQNLPKLFQWLKTLGAQFCHYKVCSTFDSSPTHGSIGRACDIGLSVFQQRVAALVVGTPQLKRFTFAGHLFAAYQGAVYRIDRHPVMSRHPVTPMDESDLRLHLAKQTTLPVTLVAPDMPDAGLGLIDVFDDATQLRAGEAMLALSGDQLPFVVGASGVEYALVKALAARGAIPGHAAFAPLPAAGRIIAVSGSVSPTTERQIRIALAHGYEGLAVDPLALAGEAREAKIKDVSAQAVALAKRGSSVIVHTALGPSTDVGAALAGLPDGRRRIGESLGMILKTVLAETGIRRAIIAGGDSSSHALAQLDVHALTTRFPLKATPGSPLCIAHSASPALNGLELAMKGGQLGGDPYFVQLRDGLS